MGKKTSIYLPDEIVAALDARGLTPMQAIRLGIEQAAPRSASETSFTAALRQAGYVIMPKTSAHEIIALLKERTALHSHPRTECDVATCGWGPWPNPALTHERAPSLTTDEIYRCLQCGQRNDGQGRHLLSGKIECSVSPEYPPCQIQGPHTWPLEDSARHVNCGRAETATVEVELAAGQSMTVEVELADPTPQWQIDNEEGVANEVHGQQDPRHGSDATWDG